MAETTLKRRPGRAASWGFLIGLAMVIYLTVVWPVIAFDDWNTVAIKAVVVIAIVMALSVLWGLFGPAKKPKGSAEPPPPAESDLPPPPAENAPSPAESE